MSRVSGGEVSCKSNCSEVSVVSGSKVSCNGGDDAGCWPNCCGSGDAGCEKRLLLRADLEARDGGEVSRSHGGDASCETNFSKENSSEDSINAGGDARCCCSRDADCEKGSTSRANLLAAAEMSD